MAAGHDGNAVFRSLLVHVGNDGGSAGRVRLAASLAQQHGIRLIGVAAADEYVSYYGEGGMVSAAMVAEEAARVERTIATAKSIFDRATTHVAQKDWRSAHWPATLFVVEEARRADLVIVGQDTAGGRSAPSFSASQVILGAGRPVLVVPPSIDELDLRRIVIGWKDTKEIRRTLLDAMPLLRGAEEVVVVTVTRDPPPSAWDDLKTYLGWHEIAATFVHRSEEEGRAADILVDLAGVERAGLIVAGAYGHWKWRERLFGGVTRDLVSNASVCCFMSH